MGRSRVTEVRQQGVYGEPHNCNAEPQLETKPETIAPAAAKEQEQEQEEEEEEYKEREEETPSPIGEQAAVAAAVLEGPADSPAVDGEAAQQHCG
jgi:hypothetical protein